MTNPLTLWRRRRKRSIDLLHFAPSISDLERAALSRRHDFGLMSPEEQSLMVYEAHEWLHAWGQTLPFFKADIADVEDRP